MRSKETELITTCDVRYVPPTEMLGHTAPLAWETAMPVLGYPIVFRSNSPTVIDIVEDTLGHWRDLDPALVEAAPPGRTTIVVHPGREPQERVLDGDGRLMEPFSYRLHGDVFVAMSGESVVTAQFALRQATAFVTPAMVASDLPFRSSVVESLALSTIMKQNRVAIHGGGVTRHGRTVLLLGRSGRGKSTLCYACVRRGFRLLTEDVISVSLEPFRLWGGESRLHLMPDARRFFPELRDVPPRMQANGKLKLGVPVPRDQLQFFADEAISCLVARHDADESVLEPIDRAEIVRALCEQRESGFDLYTDETVVAVAEALTRGPCYRLTVGQDPDRAVDVLERLTKDSGWHDGAGA